MLTFYQGLSDVFFIALESAAGSGLQSNPTLASGDVTISKDGGTFNNLATLPDPEPNSTKGVRIKLSASETTCNNGLILFEDAAGSEWLPVAIPFRTIPATQIERQNTAQAGGSSTITLDSSANANNSYYNNMTIRIIDGTGAGQENTVSSYVGSTKVATVANAWGTNPDNTSVFRIFKQGELCDVVRWNGTAVATPDTVGYPKVTVKSGTGSGELNLTSGAVDTSKVSFMPLNYVIKQDATSKTIYVFISSLSSPGQGLTGLVYNTAGLVSYYVRDKASPVSISLVTQTPTGSYSSGGFCEVSSANFPGLYRLDIPNAAVVAGSEKVLIVLHGATNMNITICNIDLTYRAVDVRKWGGSDIATPIAPGVPSVNTTYWNNEPAAANLATGTPSVAVQYWYDDPVVSPSISGFPQIDVLYWRGDQVSIPTVTGYPKMDLNYWRGTQPNTVASGRIDSSVGAYQTGLTPLQPTVAGRTLDVSTGGEAGIDWANIGTPGATVALSSTTTSIDSTTITSIVDALLKRDFSSVTGEAQRSVLNALRKLMNKISISGSTLTIYKENDTTAAYTQTIATNANLEPISTLDTN